MSRKHYDKAVSALEYYINLIYSSQEIEEYMLGILDECKRKLRAPIVPSDDVHQFKQLPEAFPIYRGFREPLKQLGISWSLSRYVAEGFSYGAIVQLKHVGPPIIKLAGRSFFIDTYTEDDANKLPPGLVTGICRKSDIVAYTNANFEEEIIIDPNRVQNIVNLEPGEKARKQREANIIALREGREEVLYTAEPLDWLLTNKQH